MAVPSQITDIDKIDAVTSAVEDTFQGIFENDSGAAVERGFVTVVSGVTAKSVTHSALGAMPIVRKWIDEKRVDPTRAYAQTLELGRHHSTIEFDRMDVVYDPTGLVGRRVRMFGQNLRYWYDQIAFDDVIVANPNSYDGVAMFSSSHPHGPGGANQSNSGSSALSVSALDTTIQTMQLLQSENGAPLNINPNLLVCGPKLRKIAQDITGSTRLAGIDNAGNIDSGTRVAAGVIQNWVGGVLDVLVWPRLAGTQDDYWFLVDTNHEAKAVVVYEGRSPELIALTAMEGERRYYEDQLSWSVESDDVAGAGAWQVIYRHAL